jgi:hypothetical protein
MLAGRTDADQDAHEWVTDSLAAVRSDNKHVDGDDFVAHLRTLPDDEAVALATQAVREGDTKHNHRQLFLSRSFVQWLKDMVKSGALMGGDK